MVSFIIWLKYRISAVLLLPMLLSLLSSDVSRRHHGSLVTRIGPAKYLEQKPELGTYTKLPFNSIK